MDEQIIVHIMEFYSALKWNEILIHAITWMKLEDSLIEAERMMIAKGWRKYGKGSYCLIGTKFQFYKMKRVL